MKIKSSNFLNVILTAALLVSLSLTGTISTVGNEYAPGEYNPWADINDDGYIELTDFWILSQHYGTHGIPIDRTPLINGDFETGTFASWKRRPNPDGSDTFISSTVVHNGSYSAGVDDWRHSYNWICQDIYPRARLPVESGVVFEGWVYPLRVGELVAEFPFSGIRIWFYNESSKLPEFYILYSWCLSSTAPFNGSHACYYLAGWNASEWNFISRNVTADVHARFGEIDYSNIVLYSVDAIWHLAGTSPGAFYIDDLKISSS